MKTIVAKIKLAFVCFKDSPALWLVAAIWLILLGMLAAGNFEKWPPLAALAIINLLCLLNIPTDEERRKYHEQHPYGDM